MRAEAVQQSNNAILHPWLKRERTAILKQCPPAPEVIPIGRRWQDWDIYPAADQLDRFFPPVRMLLIWDNLAGQKSHSIVQWCPEQCILLLSTPLQVPGSTWRSQCKGSSNGERCKGIIPMKWKSLSSGLLMLSLAEIATQRRSSGVESGMHAGLAPMHGGIVWEDPVPLLLMSSPDAFARFATAARPLKPDRTWQLTH